MITVIIPAHNEESYLNHTIDNLVTTANARCEIIVVDQGGNGQIDSRAKVITPDSNVGERAAMNMAATAATNDFLFRIDAHCDFSPIGWDTMLCEATGEKDLTMAVLTAIRMPWDQAPQAEKDEWLAKHTREDWHDWERLKGHWYGLTRLIATEGEQGRKGIEAKWQGANRDHAHYHGVHPTMGATGCGMCMRTSWYWQIGGADESLPPMGAIGEEFAIKTWACGGKCQVHTDVMVGHVFGTGGYPTGPVRVAQQALYDVYHDTLPEIAARPEFASFEGLRLIRADQPGPDLREVIVSREDMHDTTDNATGRLIRRKIERFKYVWLSSEHLDEQNLTDKEIELKYTKQAVKVGQEITYYDEQGEAVPLEVGVKAETLCYTPPLEVILEKIDDELNGTSKQ